MNTQPINQPSDEKERTGKQPESFGLLEKLAEARGNLHVELSSVKDPALSRIGASRVEAATQTAPYVVWLDNGSWATLDVKLRWAQLNVSGVQLTGGSVYSGQVAPFILGGSDGCSTVYAYVLEIYYQGGLVGSTGVVYPNADDGSPCSDAYGVS